MRALLSQQLRRLLNKHLPRGGPPQCGHAHCLPPAVHVTPRQKCALVFLSAMHVHTGLSYIGASDKDGHTQTFCLTARTCIPVISAHGRLDRAIPRTACGTKYCWQFTAFCGEYTP